LRESEYESRLIVDTIPGQVAVLSTSGKIERLSQRILDYYGRSLEEIARWTENENDIIHPEDRPELVRAFTHSMTTGEPGEFEPRTRRFDGPYRWFHVRWLPLRDRQGRIVRWYVLQTDIDDRKRAEQKLQQNEEELRTILDTIRQAVAMLAADGTVLYANRVALEITGAPWTTSKTIPFSWQATRTM
jgi:PAS domain S-box-containing protein